MSNTNHSEATNAFIANLNNMKEQMNRPVLMLLMEADEVSRIVQMFGDRLEEDVELVSLRLKGRDPLDSPQGGEEKIAVNEQFCLYPIQRQVEVQGRRVTLKKKEYALLHHLVTHPGTVYQRCELYKLIWGGDSSGNVSTVTVHINRIRKQIEADPSTPQYIHTVWGGGYCFKVGSSA